MSNAIQLVIDFKARKGGGAFAHLNRQTVANDLAARLTNPYLINQSEASLCGPAAYMYCLASKSPQVYAQYIIDLYEKGEATIGKISIKPGGDCKNYKMSGVRMSPVDWIGLASLRDSSNSFLDYDSVQDQLSGITTPETMGNWFKQSDFTSVANNTNLLFDKGINTLFEASLKYISGAYTCLFIGSSVFSNHKKGKAPADHWVVLTSSITIDGKPAATIKPLLNKTLAYDDFLKKKIDFGVYTWGSANYRISALNKSLTVETFLDYFYGYISAK
jgi:hypothetical protein